MATPILSPRLLEEGWRKCYSVKAELPYYFNVKTNTSVWTMPTVSDQDERAFSGSALPHKTPSSQPSAAALVPPPSKPGTTSQAEPSFSDMPNDLDRKVARRVAKYVYAKFILDQVNAIINENCEGCREDYPSQRDHECLYYGDTPAGQREVISKYFTDAAKRINMLAVQKSILAMAELCYITLDHNTPLDYLILMTCWSCCTTAGVKTLKDVLKLYRTVCLCMEWSCATT
ncbi:uncharacterized protein [Ptychodera flava]|uniref:uncharacterized protein n=1 Tax=Ptychodera flava TaxID=63121 RepID=UPI00396A6EDB